MVTLNRAVAVAMVDGPRAGLDLLEPLDATTGSPGTTASTPSAPTCWSWPATARPPARATGAARRTTSLPEQRYLEPGPPGWWSRGDGRHRSLLKDRAPGVTSVREDPCPR